MEMRFLLSIPLLFLFISGRTLSLARAQAPATPSSSYSMTDLESLESERSYDEFFAHVHDIRPSERNDYWKKMVENMGEGLLKAYLARTRLERGDFQQMERLMSIPTLHQNEFYRQRRQEVGLKWLQQCLADLPTPDSPCWQDLQAFWEKDRQEPDIAFRLLAVVGPYLPPKGALSGKLTPLFILSPLLLSDLAQSQCPRREIREVVWTNTLEAWRATINPQSFPTTLKTLAHPSCWTALRPWLLAQLHQGAGPDELDLTFTILELNGGTTPLDKDLYYLSYLLGSPARGDTFNLAWNRLQELRHRPQEREQLLALLKAQSPLPGAIFADLDLAKRRAIVRHLRSNFPEYLDFYAHTCVDFFGGKKRFPEGNPALACREVFDLAGTEKDLLPAPVVENFKRGLNL